MLDGNYSRHRVGLLLLLLHDTRRRVLLLHPHDVWCNWRKGRLGLRELRLGRRRNVDLLHLLRRRVDLLRCVNLLLQCVSLLLNDDLRHTDRLLELHNRRGLYMRRCLEVPLGVRLEDRPQHRDHGVEVAERVEYHEGNDDNVEPRQELHGERGEEVNHAKCDPMLRSCYGIARRPCKRTD